MKLTIRKKIFLCSLVPVCLLGAIVIFAAATFVRGSIIEQVKKSLQGTAVATLAAYDQNSGEYMEAENGAIWKGSYNISQSENLVDTIKAESGMDVTFFYGSRRIMTSALDQNGSRILGSPAGDLIVEKVLKGGEEYFSENVSMDGTLYGFVREDHFVITVASEIMAILCLYIRRAGQNRSGWSLPAAIRQKCWRML